MLTRNMTTTQAYQARQELKKQKHLLSKPVATITVGKTTTEYTDIKRFEKRVRALDHAGTRYKSKIL